METEWNAVLVQALQCLSRACERFAEKLEQLIDYVAPRGRVVLATCFWKNEIVDDAIRALAEKRGEPCVELTCEGEHQTAIGLFAHKGVAMHPGDEGMEMIAQRLADAVLA